MIARRRLPVEVIIADTGPLISLAACGRLHLLNEFRRPVRIPDIIREECLRFHGRVGHSVLAEWFDDPDCPVEILPTPFLQAWRDATAADDAEPGSRRSAGIGDAAIAWILAQAQHGLGWTMPTLIMTEDGPFGDGVLRDRFPEVHVLSKRAFLRTLENFGIIASAEAIVAEIAAAGRQLARYMADRPGHPVTGSRTTWTESLVVPPPQTDDGDSA